MKLMAKGLPLVILGIMSIPATAAMRCDRYVGMVQMVPDFSCAVVAQSPNPNYLNLPGTCFSFQLKGRLQGNGVAGLTSEGMVHPMEQSYAARGTPAFLQESGLPITVNEFGIPESRRFFTARSVMSLAGSHLFTADAGVINGPRSVEQLVITGGDGAYAGATGYLYASGDLLGTGGKYEGEVCLPTP